MTEKKEASGAYNDARRGFDELSMDEQARFLVEAALAMVSQGAREAGDVVSQVIDDIVERVRTECESAESESGDAEPEAAKKSPGRKSTAKKSATKKTATKPRSTRKKADSGSSDAGA